MHVPAADGVPLSALPAAQLTVFPAGHMLPVERTAGVAARLATLVRGDGVVAASAR
jgi:hypothetical protein